jgi:hypothetical protein
MKKGLLLFLLTLSLSVSAKGKITINVSLSPAGSFQAVSGDLKGKLVKAGEQFSVKKIGLRVKTLKTGIDLRDEHLWGHLNSQEHPRAYLTNVAGKDGKASGELEVNGVKKTISIQYSEKDGHVLARFEVKASDFSLKKASYLGVGVEDIVTIDIDLPFEKK